VEHARTVTDLNDNHRRHILALLRHVDRLLAEVEHVVAGRASATTFDVGAFGCVSVGKSSLIKCAHRYRRAARGRDAG
jgi:hypothetical protein